MNTKNAFDFLLKNKIFDQEKAEALSQKGAEEGIVLLENNGVLPLSAGDNVAFFGKMQKKYLISGTGSGGNVNVRKSPDIFTCLSSLGLKLDHEVEDFYNNHNNEFPIDEGNGWTLPSCQQEPFLDEGFVTRAAERNKTAFFLITRTAGEDCELPAGKGGFELTDAEKQTVTLLRSRFDRLVILLNVCGIIDLSFLRAANPDAMLLLWQGGMMGGAAAANIVMGVVSPSGRMPDTVAEKLSDYPAFENYGKAGKNYYKEDIFVGYRYFYTFAPEKVLYPFGYGLSYTQFEYCLIDFHRKNGKTKVQAVVTNVGDVTGKFVLQCYVAPPCGKLGNPARILADFCKTPLLSPGESYTAVMEFCDLDIASYDDSGATGCRYSYLLEPGEYNVLLGDNVRDATEEFDFFIDEELVVKTCESALAPTEVFERLENSNKSRTYAPVPQRPPLSQPVPDEIPRVEKDGLTLASVARGEATVRDIVARMSDDDLICMVRAEGMSSPKVTPGTAAAFCGVTPSLKALGIPTLCCTDGPSGIRMVSEAKCVSYPIATCIAASFNTSLAQKMYFECGCELASHNVDILLGPGTNIHRFPLCGRNFEYFSEDPLLSGKMAAAICRGLDEAGVSGAVKHFLANNQEADRHGADSVISERAIREIYAKPFEICVRESPVRSVMTSYNPVNGRWAASNYDLTVRLLRNDFGFSGFVMSDWWARVSGEDGSASVTNLAAMVHAQNDVYMVCPHAPSREDNLPHALKSGELSVGELQQCAVHLLEFAVDSLSFMAQEQGVGKRDLKAETENSMPKATISVTDGKAVFVSPAGERAIVEVGIASDTPVLTQTAITLYISTKSAAGFLVGGTEGKTESHFCEVSLIPGENNFVFDSASPLAKVVFIKIY